MNVAQTISKKEIWRRQSAAATRELAGFASLDFYIFETFLTPHYNPRENPLAMVVGASLDEAPVIRFFHQQEYGIPLERVKIAGCTTRPTIIKEERRRYDLFYCGEIGEGGMESLWRQGAYELGAADFDLAYIRFPNLSETQNWYSAFESAYLCVRPEGAIISVLAHKDVAYFEKLKEMLRTRLRFEPVVSENTGIIDSYGLPAFHYWVAIFKTPEQKLI